MNMKFRQFLEMKFLEWQQQSGGRKTVEDFSDYLGIGRTTLSMWLNRNERVPQGDNIRKLADKLGLEVYDVLGLDRPDPDLHYIQQNWEHLSPEARLSLRKQMENLAIKNETKRAPSKRRTSAP